MLSISSREFAISEIAQPADKVRRDQRDREGGKGGKGGGARQGTARQGGILHLDFAQIAKELK